MRIVDTHVHLSSPDQVRYPRTPGLGLNPWEERGGAAVEDLLVAMDRCGVDAAVLVQAHGPYRFTNDYCADARAAAPDRLASVSIIDMASADRLERLAYWARERGMGGTRLTHLPPVDPPWLDDPATEPVWRRAAELGVRVNVCTVRRYLPALERLLAWAPPMPIALDHCALVDLAGAHPETDALERLLRLARFPNLHLKVSPHVLALAGTFGRSGPQLVADLASVFGARRMMWGTDWPNAGRPYDALVAEGVASAVMLPRADRDDYLGGTALRLWPELRAGILSRGPDSGPPDDGCRTR